MYVYAIHFNRGSLNIPQKNVGVLVNCDLQKSKQHSSVICYSVCDKMLGIRCLIKCLEWYYVHNHNHNYDDAILYRDISCYIMTFPLCILTSIWHYETHFHIINIITDYLIFIIISLSNSIIIICLHCDEHAHSMVVYKLVDTSIQNLSKYESYRPTQIVEYSALSFVYSVYS